MKSFAGIFPGGTTWADYPGFGVNNTWVAITANMFTIASMPTFVAAKMWVIDKATALAGGTLTVTEFPPGFDSAGGASGFTLKPAVTFSAGVAQFSTEHRTAQAFIDAADARLYEAKRRGRNQVVAS